jgi:hypothetical protein
LIDFLKELKKLTLFLESEKVPYMIFGGIANSLYGNTRQTFDIDIKIILETNQKRSDFINGLSSFSKILPQKPIQFIEETNVLPIEIIGIKVDFVFANLPYEIEAIERSVENNAFGFKIRVCQLEDLIIQKVISTREKDWQDIYVLIRLNKDALNWDYLIEHCKSLAEFLTKQEIINKIIQYRNEK